MYLSRLLLNPRSRAVWRDLADCQQMHRTIMSAFPQAVNGTAARVFHGVLYRAERRFAPGQLAVLVQSVAQQDWSSLPGNYLGTGEESNPACKQIGGALDRITTGQVLAFRLSANPTRKIDTKTGPDGRRRHGRRVELNREEDQVAWLRRKAEACGFTLLSVESKPNVPNVRAMENAKVSGSKVRESAGDLPRLTFGSVQFEGLLKVTDSDRFRQSIEQGVGPAKAYGFGLLSIAPAGGAG